MAVLAATAQARYGAIPVTVSAAVPTNVGASTYDLLTASGDVAVTGVTVAVGGTLVTGLVSVAIQTNDTVVTTVLTAGEGAVANLLANTTVKTFTTSFILHATKKLQYTTVGVGLGGSMAISVTYMPLTSGAVLS